MAERLTLDLALFEERLAAVRERVGSLAGDRAAPRIVVVTKYLSAEDCGRLRGAGVGPLGENRAQDLEGKVAPGEDREGWHFIGHLQRNKLPVVIPRIGCLHSVDSARLAERLDRWVEEHASRPLRCLVQVNISGEGTKGGLSPSQARECIPGWIDRHRSLRIEGLMTMAPDLEAELCRPVFRGLRELRDEIRGELPGADSDRFRELSMGMSGDYEVAVEEGATLLRLGRMLYS